MRLRLLPVLLLPLFAPRAEERRFPGLCDGSAAVGVSADRILVANDEDNALRLHDAAGGPALETFDLSAWLAADGVAGEADLEGAARLGDRAYWIGSHSASDKGKPRPARRVLFATALETAGDRLSVRPLGKPYRRLVEDLAAHPPLVDLDLAAAAARGAEQEGGLNIEALAARPDGGLWLGFRNPCPGGKALLVPLLNPAEAMEGGRAKLGDPVRLDLGGLGLRDLAFAGEGRGYVLVAGPAAGKAAFRLFRWSGRAEDPPRPEATEPRPGHRPEAAVFLPGRDDGYLLLSDDSGVSLGAQDCRDAAPDLRGFRAAWRPF